MAHFNEHCTDCERLLGDRCEDVNRWIDDAFADFGPRHRFVKHHWTGVERAGQLFGNRGRKAAIIHILRDCGHIPTESQWISKSTDLFGMNPDTRFNGYWAPQQFDEAALNLLNQLFFRKEQS